MINFITQECENIYTEGFEATTSSLSLLVTEGKFHMSTLMHSEEIVRNDEGKIVEINPTTYDEWETDNYPAFQFEIEPDNAFTIIYDVYLLDLPSVTGNIIHLDRTILSDASPVSFYNGEDKVRHCLLSIIVPPNCTDLTDAEIRVNKVVLKNANTST